MTRNDDDNDRRLRVALVRYEIISAYLALEPARGQRATLRDQLASKTWTGPDGEPMSVAAETIRTWVRRYRNGGLDALKDRRRPAVGVQALTDAQVELLCRLKKEVPERSLDRIIEIAETTGLAPQGVLRRSTVHRVLRGRGLSKRKARVPDAEDLDRFEAAFPNDLWQSDMLVGPWLPHPDRPGKMRRANLFAFIDDHSRALLHGRFSFRENLPALELVFRRALQKHGVSRRLYYDNGQVYRAGHMKAIAAALGIHRIVFTRVRRPMGHGKIEALNRLVRSSFLAEMKASQIHTLDALNEAFVAWMDWYNKRVHSETGEAPRDRWRAGAEHVRYADEGTLQDAFTWKETRTPDKAGVFSLLGTRYQVGPTLARRKIEVRFDPEALHEVEVWHQRAFVERVRPLEIGEHRRSKAPASPDVTSPEPTMDWLDHLVQKRRNDGVLEPSPQVHVTKAHQARADADASVLAIVTSRLGGGVADPEIVADWLARFGPIAPESVATCLDEMLLHDACDHHVTYYLDAIRQRLRGDAS